MKDNYKFDDRIKILKNPFYMPFPNSTQTKNLKR